MAASSSSSHSHRRATTCWKLLPVTTRDVAAKPFPPKQGRLSKWRDWLTDFIPGGLRRDPTSNGSTAQETTPRFAHPIKPPLPLPDKKPEQPPRQNPWHLPALISMLKALPRLFDRSDKDSDRPNPDAKDEPQWKKVNRLKKAALQGNWQTAKAILNVLPDDKTRSNVLNMSIAGGKRTRDFTSQLVEYLPSKSLTRTESGITALYSAAAEGNKEAAEILVTQLKSRKHDDLVHVADKYGNLPVHAAARFSHREVLEYLMEITNWSNCADAKQGQLRLFCYVVEAEFYDIAMKLVHEYPHIATIKDAQTSMTALDHLAGIESLFSGPRGFSKWEHLLCTFPQTTSIMIGKFVNKREQASALVMQLCEAMESSSQVEPRDIYEDAILKAATLGNHKVVELILDTFPGAISCLDDKLNSIFHLATKHRCEQVFSLIYRLRSYRSTFLDMKNSEGDNLLHLAAKLAPAHKLNQASGAALQMQRELRWYMEVQKIVSPLKRREKNEHGQTPEMIFREAHKRLKSDAEKWMKTTAKSCSIVAVLIVTIMFAAAITVPGGNKSDSNENKGEIGFPNFWKEKGFIAFAIADAVSLFASTTSLLVFLSILTSRFPEESFLRRHPTLLIAGLGTLFLSIAAMMVAFSATVLLVLGRKTMWILGPISAVACLGVGSFAFLQFPLLAELIFSTYGPLFDKRSGPHLH